MMHLSVVTPERAFLDVDAESITLPGKMGEMQVLTGHVPCLIELKPGIVHYADKDKKSQRFMVGQGFAEISAQTVTILSEIARQPEDVVREHEQALQNDLFEKMKKISDTEELNRASVELERSVASIKLLE